MKDQIAIAHQVGKAFKPVPEVYQVELTNACQLSCPMCLRTTTMDREPMFLDLHLIRLMQRRGDFAGSFFVELQFAGEPTLHPEFAKAVAMIRACGLLVGTSTNLVAVPMDRLPELLAVDSLTISIDSPDPVVYEKTRFPAKFPDFMERIMKLAALLRVHKLTKIPVPFVELQGVKTGIVAGSGDAEGLERFVLEHGWGDLFAVRVITDCCDEMRQQGNGVIPQPMHCRSARLCINPFFSISVLANGDVVSCCYVYTSSKIEVNYYGNLYESSLEQIWAGERVREMQRQHIEGCLTGQCAMCYNMSPVNIHLLNLSRMVRRKDSA